MRIITGRQQPRASTQLRGTFVPKEERYISWPHKRLADVCLSKPDILRYLWCVDHPRGTDVCETWRQKTRRWEVSAALKLTLVEQGKKCCACAREWWKRRRIENDSLLTPFTHESIKIYAVQAERCDHKEIDGKLRWFPQDIKHDS